MARRCPTAKVVSSGWLEGYRLRFRGGSFGSVATVEPSPDDLVPILIWELKPQDEANLDLYGLNCSGETLSWTSVGSMFLTKPTQMLFTKHIGTRAESAISADSYLHLFGIRVMNTLASRATTSVQSERRQTCGQKVLSASQRMSWKNRPSYTTGSNIIKNPVSMESITGASRKWC